jgi:TATA-binding protein-associated factor Taf7
MALIDTLKEINDAERIADVERREKGYVVEGDFEGSVTGYWVKLNESGAGVVTFNNKQYITETIGFVSLPKGTAVELSFADGTYFSKY